MEKQRGARKTTGNAKDGSKNQRARPGQPGEMPESQRLGATEEQVVPLTPPMARSDEQPNDPDRGAEPDKGLDPADEITPG